MTEKRVRTCVACGNASSKGDLVRFVRTDLGVDVDPTGRANGRGAYLCPRQSCFDTARKRRSLERALRTKIDGPSLDRLETQFEHAVRRHSDAQ